MLVFSRNLDKWVLVWCPVTIGVPFFQLSDVPFSESMTLSWHKQELAARYDIED